MLDLKLFSSASLFLLLCLVGGFYWGVMAQLLGQTTVNCTYQLAQLVAAFIRVPAQFRVPGVVIWVTRSHGRCRTKFNECLLYARHVGKSWVTCRIPLNYEAAPGRYRSGLLEPARWSTQCVPNRERPEPMQAFEANTAAVLGAS